MKLTAYFFSLLLIFTAISCESRMTDTLAEAGTNRKELLEVINHYSIADSQHMKAALYLLTNLKGHHGIKSQTVDSIISFIQKSDTVPSDKCLESMWKRLAVRDSLIRLDDTKTLSSTDIISNIDEAFIAWKSSPWYNHVNFELFCEYILPHRVMDEEFSTGWRNILRQEYLSVITDETNIYKAFVKIHNEVQRRFRGHTLGFPYIPRLDKIGLIGTGSCIQGCAYEVAVMRALGIPVAIDYVHQWGNYSQNGHAWCALILEDGTYTVASGDSIARKYNPIDASTFKLNKPMPKGYPHTAEFKKRAVKVWRHTYKSTVCGNSPDIDPDKKRRHNMEDVSVHYGFMHSLTLKPNKDVARVWLCTYSINKKWIPQTHADVINGKATFRGLADSVMLLPMTMKEGMLKPIGLPFYIDNGFKIDISPTSSAVISGKFTRKYPISANWLNRYAQIPSTRIEGSNSSDFYNPEVLYTISEIPVYHNSYSVTSCNSYRYIRAIADLPSYRNMDHMVIYDKEGNLLANGNSDVIDLGNPRQIGIIEYYPWHDGNFVVSGHDYELLYWDYDHWKSIARKRIQNYEVLFDRIPDKALLILRDHTEGREERPFTICNGKQIWW